MAASKPHRADEHSENATIAPPTNASFLTTLTTIAMTMLSNNTKFSFALVVRIAIWTAILQICRAAPQNAVAAVDQPRATISGHVLNIANGQYLNKARVTFKANGFAQTVYTDEFGAFRIVSVPNGSGSLEVYYTDLDTAIVPVDVHSGEPISQEIELTSAARYKQKDSTVKLDPFLVAVDRETNAQAIASNEQRFSPNLKNVMSTDALGNVLGSSVGEFLKYMPGITVEYDNSEVSGINLRGIGGGMTAITTDGALASNIWVSPTRSVDTRNMALNDISRIEVTKVPMPSNPADSLGGSVNMVTKSAFERSGRELRYGLSFVGNSEDITLGKTPTSYRDRLTHKILPGANVDFTWPITKTFGIVLAAMTTNVFSEWHLAQKTWGNVGTGTNAVSASTSNPFLQTLQVQDGPRNIMRNTISARADWKVTPHSVLSLSYTGNYATTEIGQLLLTLSAGANGTPTVAGGVPMTWSPTYTMGATGRGSITNNGTNQKIEQLTDTPTLRYRFDDGFWKLETGLSRSATTMKRINEAAGFFYQTSAVNMNPIRINFLNINGDLPSEIDAYDNNNQPVDWRDLSNYRGSQAVNSTTTNFVKIDNAYFNLRRSLSVLPFTAALQVGGAMRVNIQNNRPTQDTWVYAGPDGISGTTASVVPLGMQVYKGVDPFFKEIQGIQWMSSSRAWEAFLNNPLLFQQPVANQFNNANYRITNSEYFEETVRAAYVQAEASFLHDRLRFLGGVRFEQTKDKGEGAFTNADAVWQRDAKGNYVRDTAGNRIRIPEAGAASSLQELALTTKERAAVTYRTYGDYYPSLHATFDATENLIIRAAFARTYGRPDIEDILPRTVATPANLNPDDPTPATGRGTLSIRNPTLIPWTANNFDLSFEYYNPKGGMVSAGVFLKEIKNFFGAGDRIATQADLTALNLDPAYLGWDIKTKFNAGDAQIKGAEINARYPLRLLGTWGTHFTVFGNATKLELTGAAGANFSTFIPLSGNVGTSFDYKRASVIVRWNYRGLERTTPQAAFGPDGYEYIKARTYVDINASYQLTNKLSLTANVNNIFNVPQTFLRYGSATPDYARQFWHKEYGIQLAVGMQGKF